MKLGHSGIDDDHERLIGLANEVECLVTAGCSTKTLQTAFHALVVYTVEHFEREESLMRQQGYPSVSSHQREHREVVDWLLHVEAAISTCGEQPSTVVAQQTLSLFEAWIDHHLIHYDKPVVEFLEVQSSTSAHTAVQS